MTVVPLTATIQESSPRVHQAVWRQLLRNPLSVGSLVVLVVFFAVAALQPLIQPFPADQVDPALANATPFTSKYVLGGDRFGHDILSHLIAATPGAVRVTVVLAVVAFVIGVITGLLAGYIGRFVDTVATWIFSAVMAVPGVVVLIALYTLLGSSPTVAMVVYGVLVSPSLFWMVRALTRGIRNEVYIDAARVAGLSGLRIVGRHVLTAIRGPVILMTATLAGAGLAIQAGLEFLGLGDSSEPSWGGMLADAFNNLYLAPIQLLWPAAALGLVVGAFSLLSIGLRDVLEGTNTAARRRVRMAHRRGASVPPVVAETEGAASGGGSDAPLFAIERLTIAYPNGDGATTVVDGVTLSVESGEILGVVGESGSGKTQVVLAALGLLPDEAVVNGGSIRFLGHELVGMTEKELRAYRGRRIAYVPQEPTANLDPSFRIGSQLVAGIRAQSGLSVAAARDLALSSLDRVGIRDPKRVLQLYPHQISGGMAQRVLIAGAVACRPSLLIADEPTTALDVTIQAEVLDLLRELQGELGMGVLVVTHNFGVVADLCDRVVVMRSGQIVEQGRVSDVFTRPQHDYTKALLGAVLDHADTRPAFADRVGA